MYPLCAFLAVTDDDILYHVVYKRLLRFSLSPSSGRPLRRFVIFGGTASSRRTSALVKTAPRRAVPSWTTLIASALRQTRRPCLKIRAVESGTKLSFSFLLCRLIEPALLRCRRRRRRRRFNRHVKPRRKRKARINKGVERHQLYTHLFGVCNKWNLNNNDLFIEALLIQLCGNVWNHVERRRRFVF